MKITNENMYDQIISWNNLLNAYDKTNKGRLKYKSESLIFYQNKIENLTQLYDEIISQTYEPMKYNSFKVYEPKERIIYAPCYRDKIVQHMVNNVLRDFYEPKFIYDSYACIRNKGQKKAVCRLHQFMKHSQWYYEDSVPYIVKMDVSKFFPSIDRSILKSVLINKIKDERVLFLIESIIDSSPEDLGLPLGNLTSQLLANVYMNELDQYLKHGFKCKYYIRYADDMFMIVNNKQQAKLIIDVITIFLNDELNLIINPKKNYYRPVYTGIDGLGFKITTKNIKLSSKNKRSYRNKLSKPKSNIGYFSISKDSANIKC